MATRSMPFWPRPATTTGSSWPGSGLCAPFSGRLSWSGITRAAPPPHPPERPNSLFHRRPAPKDQRTASAYIFGAICAAHGTGAGLVLPRCTTEGMTLHLKEIAQAVAPGAHALVLVDQAGWHQSKRLVVPDNITLVPLPAKAPELNPVENIWQYMREN